MTPQSKDPVLLVQPQGIREFSHQPCNHLVRTPFHIIVPQSYFDPSTPQTRRFAENLLLSG